MRIKSLALAVLIAVLGSFVAVSGANAHTDVVSTSPADGSVTEVPPATISVTFSQPPITEGAAILLADVSGNEIAVGPATFEGAKLSVASPPDLPPGEYKVTWRISAEDGHALTGEFGFTYNGDAVVSNATPDITAYATDLPVTADASATRAESAEDNDSNSWIVLLAAFFISSMLGTLYVAKKRK